MQKYLCNSCGEKIDDTYNFCPVCNTINYRNPTVIKVHKETKYNPSEGTKYKWLFIILIIAIVMLNIICGVLIFLF